MALSSLDPLARSGGVLPSADPSALEVAMARNKQEDDLAKGIQALNQQAKAAEDKIKSKEKLAADKQLTELTKGTTFMPHTEASAKYYNDFIMREGKRWQDFDSGVGGDPMQPGTQAWIDRNRDLQAWEQLQASSKQIQDKYAAVSGHVLAHKGDYALDTLERIQEDYANPQYLADGTFPDDPVAYIDLNKAIKTRFEAIKPRVTAWASQDGTASGTFEQVQFDDLKAHSEEMAVENPDLAAKLGETYDSYTPEKQQQIQAMMRKHKISEPAAVALDLAVAMFGEGKETQISEQVSGAGYGRQVEEAGQNWFTEAIWGELEGIIETTEMKGAPVGVPRGGALPGPDIGPTMERDRARTGIREGKQWKGWKWDKKDYVSKSDSGTEKTITTTREIKEYQYNDKAQTMTLTVGQRGTDKDDEKVVIPYDEIESKFKPRVAANNSGEILAKGKQDIADNKVYGSDQAGMRGKNATIEVRKPAYSGGKKKAY